MMETKKRGFRFGVVLAMVFALTAMVVSSAQAIPGFLEGPITDMTDDGTGGGTITVNGVTAIVTPATNIYTATRGATDPLIFSDIAPTKDPITGEIDYKPLPGKPFGFIGGTCLCATEVDLTTGVVTITDLTALPQEHVFVGAFTAHDCATSACNGPGDVLEMDGVPMVFNNDPRVPSAVPALGGIAQDLTGKYLVPATGPLTTGSAEGYMSEDGKLYYYLLEADSGKLLAPPTVAEVSVTRAQARDRGASCEYRIAGQTNNPADGAVDVVVGDQTMMTTAANKDPLTPTVGVWAIRSEVAGACSNVGTVYFGFTTDSSGNRVGGAFTVFDISVR